MGKLNIFIDESGDFGNSIEKPSYYLVTFLFHEQQVDLSENIRRLEKSIDEMETGIEYIHTGPIIRREGVFTGYTIDERRKMLYKMLNFFNSSKISHATVIVDKKKATGKALLSQKLQKEIINIIVMNYTYFSRFEQIEVYYDYGQAELSAILKKVFSSYFNNVEFKRAEPQKYKLLQAADFVCTFELLKIKNKEKNLSKSEERFFYKPQELKKTFLKSIDKKKWK